MPAATEILLALGLGDEIVGVTHACLAPPQAQALPRVTVLDDQSAPPALGPTRPPSLAAPLSVDQELVHQLAPDLIVTETESSVHELSAAQVRELGEELDSQPMVLALDPRTLGEVLGDVRTLAQATDTKDEGVEIIREASDRIDRIRIKVRHGSRPRVAALSWLDPPETAGLWVPQLIDYAGGEDVLGFAGEPAESSEWATVTGAAPDLLLVMPSRFDAALAYREAEMHRDQLLAVGAGEIVALDSLRYFSHPGLQLIDGLELLAAVIHPELVEANPEHDGGALTVEL